MKCRAKTYSDSNIVFRSPIICWGFKDQPKCKYLIKCLMDYKNIFESNGKERRFKNIIRKAEFESKYKHKK